MCAAASRRLHVQVCAMRPDLLSGGPPLYVVLASSCARAVFRGGQGTRLTPWLLVGRARCGRGIPPCPNPNAQTGTCVCVGRPRRAVAALAGSCASTAQGSRYLRPRAARATGVAATDRKNTCMHRKHRHPARPPAATTACVLGRVLTRGACPPPPRLGKQSAPLVPRGHQSVVRTVVATCRALLPSRRSLCSRLWHALRPL